MTHPVLTWISETRTGKITRLRDASAAYVRSDVATVPHKATARWLNDLASLAMLELDWIGDTWRAIRPTLTEIPGRFPLGLLTGSRPAMHIESLERAGLDYNVIAHNANKFGLPTPPTVLVHYDKPPELPAAASEIGFGYSPFVADALSEDLTEIALGDPAAGPNWAGGPVERFEVESTLFVSLRGRTSSDGLYRQMVQGRWRHWSAREGLWHSAERNEGIALELATNRTQYLSWRSSPEEASIGSLFVAPATELPLGHARAATLCSGLPPRRGTQTRNTIYENVPRSIATRIARSVLQPLDIL